VPELPEVETIRRQLEQKAVGEVINKIEILEPKMFIGDPKDVYRIQDYRRRPRRQSLADPACQRRGAFGAFQIKRAIFLARRGRQHTGKIYPGNLLF